MFRAYFTAISLVSTCCFALAFTALADSKIDAPVTYERALEVKQSKDFAKAEQLFQQLVKKQPENAEFWFQLGLVQRFQEKREQALKSQQTAQELSPNNHDIRLEIARLHSWNQNYDKAEKLVNIVLEAQPDYGDAIELSNNIQRIRSAPKEGEREYKWQVDVGHERSTFSRRPQPDWRQSFFRIGHWVTDDTLLHTRFESVQRFNQLNEHYEFGVTHIFNNIYNANISVGYTPDSIFIPEWRVKAGGEARLFEGYDFLNTTWLQVNVQHDRYKNLNTTLLKPTLRYAINDKVEVQGQYINVFDENDKHLQGWGARLNYQFNDDLRLFGGFGDAPETENAITVNTQSRFGGFSYSFTPTTTIHVSYAREDRENSFVRDIMSAALSVKF